MSRNARLSPTHQQRCSQAQHLRCQLPDEAEDHPTTIMETQDLKPHRGVSAHPFFACIQRKCFTFWCDHGDFDLPKRPGQADAVTQCIAPRPFTSRIHQMRRGANLNICSIQDEQHWCLWPMILLTCLRASIRSMQQSLMHEMMSAVRAQGEPE